MMSSATAQVPATRKAPAIPSRAIAYAAVGMYILLGFFTAHRHEPWADEAQSWLLGRDASLIHMWTKLLHYEGTPGLWQTLLHVLIRLGLPYAGINYVSMAAGVAGAWLLINYAPWPLWIRLCLPFTYYLFYQYAVVARSYALLPPLLFGCAIVWPEAARRRGVFTGLVCLLAAVSLDGFVLAGVIYAFVLLRDRREWRTRIGVACAFFVTAALLAWSAWPARDNVFVTQFSLDGAHILRFSLAMIQYAFTGEWITTILAIALSVPVLLRGGTLPLFITIVACLCAAHSVIYANVWHFGSIWMAWLFCMWLAAGRARITSLAAFSFVAVILFQGYWSFQTTRYDWGRAYSGSRAAAAFLKRNPPARGLDLVGFSTEAVKAYFSAGELERMTGEAGPAYWDWSVRGQGNNSRPLMASDRYGYFLAGYKLPAEQAQWARVAEAGGYRLVRHFDGHLFWRTGVLEPESFDLYQRISAPHLKSSIDIADPATAGQLMSGFYDLEGNAWRWTAGHFSVALARPAGAEKDGARLTLHLTIPETQIRDLGAMTLRAQVNGHSQGAGTFTTPGDVTYVRDVPAGELSYGTVLVDFAFDKARAPGGGEGRELGAIARGISIESK